MRIGIITGSGTYALPHLEAGAPREVATPFGSALVTEGRLAGAEVVHVARHGDGHLRPPPGGRPPAPPEPGRPPRQHRGAPRPWRRRDPRRHGLRRARSRARARLPRRPRPPAPPPPPAARATRDSSSNGRPDGARCPRHRRPGHPAGGNGTFALPFAEPLRRVL